MSEITATASAASSEAYSASQSTAAAHTSTDQSSSSVSVSKAITAKAVEVEQNTSETETVETDTEAVQGAIDQLNNVMDAMNKDLRFKIHDGTDEVYVEVVSPETGETLHTIPSESVLKFQERFEQALGLIFDSNA